jgi:gluconolactonase
LPSSRFNRLDGKWSPTGLASAEYEGGSLQAVDLATGEVETIIRDVDGRRLAGPNDLAFDAEGGIYLTDSGKRLGDERRLGGLYYVPPGDRRAITLAYPLDTANGVALTPGGEGLYVAETVTGRIWFWEIATPGVLRRGRTAHHPGNGTLFVTLPGYCQLDSMALDAEGNVCQAVLIGGTITVIDPTGQILETVRLPEYDPYVTNVCFGGDGHRTAFVTSSGTGRLYAIDWPWPGLPLNFEGRQAPDD